MGQIGSNPLRMHAGAIYTLCLLPEPIAGM